MRYSLASASLFASSVSAVHLPFARRVASRGYGAVSKLSPSILAQSGSVPVQVDTGSTDLWFYEYTNGLLDNARDYQSLNLTFRYGRGGVTGYVSQINVEFAGFNVANQSFLHVIEQNQTSIIENRLAAGILGLGFDTSSNINGLVQQTFNNATWGRSLLSNIFLSDLSTPNHIAFRLDRLYDGNDTDTGSFDIGTFAPGLEAVNNTAEIPIFSPSPDRNIYWSVLVDGVSVNGQNQTLRSSVVQGTTPPAGRLAAVLDTGYSYPQVTPEIAAAIYEPLGGIFDSDQGSYAIPCDAQANLAFYIGEHTIPIHPLDLASPTVLTLHNGQNVTVCYGLFQPFSSEAGSGIIDVILGDAFLRNTYTVYDFGDFVNGTSGSPRQNPYIKLLPLTDAAAASVEFPGVRKTYLDTLPLQLNLSTANSSNPQTIPGTGWTGSNGAIKAELGVGIASLAATFVGVWAVL